MSTRKPPTTFAHSSGVTFGVDGQSRIGSSIGPNGMLYTVSRPAPTTGTIVMSGQAITSDRQGWMRGAPVVVIPTLLEQLRGFGKDIGEQLGVAATKGEKATAERDAWLLALEALRNLSDAVEKAERARDDQSLDKSVSPSK